MFHGHVTIGKLLIDHKADMTLKDTIGLNFVHYAINGGHFNVIRFALDNVEDNALLERNQFGWNILIWASMTFHSLKIIAKFLIGNIFLFTVFMRCHVKIVKLLMGYDHRMKTSNEQKREALHLAEITNQCDTLAYLQNEFDNSVFEK